MSTYPQTLDTQIQSPYKKKRQANSYLIRKGMFEDNSLVSRDS